MSIYSLEGNREYAALYEASIYTTRLLELRALYWCCLRIEAPLEKQRFPTHIVHDKSERSPWQR